MLFSPNAEDSKNTFVSPNSINLAFDFVEQFVQLFKRNLTIFITSDREWVFEMAIAKFGRDLVVFSGRTEDHAHVEDGGKAAVTNAVVDYFMLGQCDLALVTGLSGYAAGSLKSTAASFYSGTRFVLDSALNRQDRPSKHVRRTPDPVIRPFYFTV